MSPARRRSREMALRALERFRRSGGKPAEIIGALAGPANLSSPDRALLANLVYGVIRHRRLLDHLLDRRLERPGRLSAAVRDVLRLGAYQLLFCDRIPDRAALHTSVELARERGGEPIASLTNAVLRRLQTDAREQGVLGIADAPLDPAVRHSYPDWMARRWTEALGAKEAGELMAAMNLHPPLTLRVNTLVADREDAAAALEREVFPVSSCRWSPQGLVAGSDLPFASLPSFAAGLFSVQDEAFQLIGALLPLEGGRTLDLFAGLGGKSTHLAQRAGDAAPLFAADIAPGKLLRLAGECRRLSIRNVLPAAADARRPPFRPGSFGAVLLDVPCSGTGIIRRHPDIKWNRGEEDIARLAGEQFLHLERASTLLGKGGVLLYATCSLEPEEGEEVVMRFLNKYATFALEDMGRSALPPELFTAAGFFRSYPHRHGIDGAFASLLRKKR